MAIELTGLTELLAAYNSFLDKSPKALIKEKDYKKVLNELLGLTSKTVAILQVIEVLFNSTFAAASIAIVDGFLYFTESDLDITRRGTIRVGTDESGYFIIERLELAGWDSLMKS